MPNLGFAAAARGPALSGAFAFCADPFEHPVTNALPHATMMILIAILRIPILIFIPPRLGRQSTSSGHAPEHPQPTRTDMGCETPVRNSHLAVACRFCDLRKTDCQG